VLKNLKKIRELLGSFMYDSAWGVWRELWKIIGAAIFIAIAFCSFAIAGWFGLILFFVIVIVGPSIIKRATGPALGQDPEQQHRQNAGPARLPPREQNGRQ
jgi:hypothetical protein